MVVNPEAGGDDDVDLLRGAVAHTLADADVGAAEVSVTLLDDAAIQALNASYLGHDRPTDVLSFRLDGDSLVGDLYVGLEQAGRQAADFGVPLREELARLAIHGTLHLLGHDHPEGAERVTSPMFELQERLLAEVLQGSD